MDLITTLPGSMMEGFFPAGWDLAKIDRLAALPPERLRDRQPWWHPTSSRCACASFEDFDTFMGHEIAREIQLARQAGRPIAFILPVGPMGMYRWAVYFLSEWSVPCDHVHGFNMDEWSDAQGNTLPPDNSRRLPVRHGTGVLRAAGGLHGPARAAAFRPEERIAHLRRSRSPS